MAIEYTSENLYDGLVAHGLIVPAGVQGAFGRGAVFEDVLERVNDLVSRIGAKDGAEAMTFPPVIDRTIIERTDYFDSFPHLAGAVFGFYGKQKEALELSARAHANKPWGEMFTNSDVCLNPAACYPLYPTMKGTLRKGGRLVSMTGWVFRNEPSLEPTRMQAFRVREFVRAGAPEEVVAWRDEWLARGVEMLTSLGLPAAEEVAADPFFGRAGAVLADGQKAQKLKFEVVVPVISQEKPTALCSFNYHLDKFGKVFEIKQSSGDVAHTACLGFGLERVVMGLFRHHGYDPKEWPQGVRGRLWP